MPTDDERLAALQAITVHLARVGGWHDDIAALGWDRAAEELRWSGTDGGPSPDGYWELASAIDELNAGHLEQAEQLLAAVAYNMKTTDLATVLFGDGAAAVAVLDIEELLS